MGNGAEGRLLLRGKFFSLAPCSPASSLLPTPHSPLPLMMIERGRNDAKNILEKLSVSLHPVALPFLVRFCIKIKLTLIKILVGIAIMRQSLYGSAYKRSNYTKWIYKHPFNSLKWQSDEHSVAKADELYRHLEAN